MAPADRIRLGSRRSPLAMAQARLAAAALSDGNGIEVEIVPVTSAGDRDQTTRLDRFAQPGVFTRALEDALDAGAIDAAVHSAKDLPSAVDPRFRIVTPLPREDAHDALVAGPDVFLASLPEGARIGSGSPRRAAQIARVRGDLSFLALRGNLQTRLDKLDRGEADALILAAAGLRRLGLAGRISELLPFDVCLCAAGQGMIALEFPAGGAWTAFLEGTSLRASALCLEAERSFLRTLGAGCAAAVAARAVIADDALQLAGRVLDVSGERMLEGSATAEIAEMESTGAIAAGLIAAAGELGARLAGELLERGAGGLLADRRPAE